MTHRHFIATALLALCSGPLIAAVPTPTPNEDGTYDLAEPAVYLTWLKLQPEYDYEANKAELAQAFFWNEYVQNRNNEFSLQDVLEDAAAEVEAAVAEWPQDIAFHIRASGEFGEYDFDKAEFAFDPVETGSYYSVPKGRELYEASPVGLTTGYVLTIADAVDIDGLPVPRDKARALIEGRTSRSGRVNRDVVVVYTVDVLSAGTTQIDYTNRAVKELKGRISSDKVYAVGSRNPVSDEALLAGWPVDSASR
ncbi:hypothetical protein S4A8_02788 [Salinisphaera sp. S4-8]|uniref:DUF4852 domain-containing protein n=1 Tax=Salinisphaera sp. S4-8 TaxID=633357 RepID=UPI003341E538